MDIGLHVSEVDTMHGIAACPDVLLVGVSAHVEEVAPLQAVSILRNTAAKLQARAIELHGGAVLSARKLDLGRNTVDKASKAAYGDAKLDGVLDVPLGDSLDYWARAELVAKITEMLRSFSVDTYKGKPSVRFGFRAPVPRVRDVTAYKNELSLRYAAQLRALTGAGEKMHGIGSWEIPNEVAQLAVSLEEVRLALVPTRKFSSSRES
jgi:hypothetical protein